MPAGPYRQRERAQCGRASVLASPDSHTVVQAVDLIQCPRRCSKRTRNWTAPWSAVTVPNSSPATVTAWNTSSPSTNTSPPPSSPPPGSRAGAARFNQWFSFFFFPRRQPSPKTAPSRRSAPPDGSGTPLKTMLSSEKRSVVISTRYRS
jgi:hypothetical protein